MGISLIFSPYAPNRGDDSHRGLGSSGKQCDQQRSNTDHLEGYTATSVGGTVQKS